MHTSMVKPSLIEKLLLTVAIAAFGLGVPILEINETHVFNSDWTPHVLIHEVWQLITNSTFAIVALWLLWKHNNSVYAAVLGLIVTGGFLSAFSLQDLYGGSMQYLDGSEKTVWGINIGVLGFGIASTIFCVSLIKSIVQSERSLHKPAISTEGV